MNWKCSRGSRKHDLVDEGEDDGSEVIILPPTREEPVEVVAADQA